MRFLRPVLFLSTASVVQSYIVRVKQVFGGKGDCKKRLDVEIQIFDGDVLIEDPVSATTDDKGVLNKDIDVGEAKFNLVDKVTVSWEDCEGKHSRQLSGTVGGSIRTWSTDSIKVKCKVDPSAKCDPHFKTWEGEKYDFHGECDLIMLSNPLYEDGQGLDVHIRTKIQQGRRQTFSVIESAAVRIGSDTFEVQGRKDWKEGPGKHDLYWLNGKQGVDLPATIGGHMITYEQVNKKTKNFVIHLQSDKGNHGERIIIQTFKHVIAVFFKSPTTAKFNGSLGMVGSYETGSKTARDGFTVIDDPIAFGLEWQVRGDDEQLFRTPGTVIFPEQCKMPAPMADVANERRLLRDVSGIVSDEDARVACSLVNPEEFNECLFDVLATGDIEMAEAYTVDGDSFAH